MHKFFINELHTKNEQLELNLNLKIKAKLKKSLVAENHLIIG